MFSIRGCGHWRCRICWIQTLTEGVHHMSRLLHKTNASTSNPMVMADSSLLSTLPSNPVERDTMYVIPPTTTVTTASAAATTPTTVGTTTTTATATAAMGGVGKNTDHTSMPPSVPHHTTTTTTNANQHKWGSDCSPGVGPSLRPSPGPCAWTCPTPGSPTAISTPAPQPYPYLLPLIYLIPNPIHPTFASIYL